VVRCMAFLPDMRPLSRYDCSWGSVSGERKVM
jgi:hypothetical protein